jgi:hypothetical protein
METIKVIIGYAAGIYNKVRKRYISTKKDYQSGLPYFSHEIVIYENISDAVREYKTLSSKEIKTYYGNHELNFDDIKLFSVSIEEMNKDIVNENFKEETLKKAKRFLTEAELNILGIQ